MFLQDMNSNKKRKIFLIVYYFKEEKIYLLENLYKIVIHLNIFLFPLFFNIFLFLI